MSELEDRRQRAREAGLDGIADPTKYSMTVAKAVNAAIETATRVRITPEMIDVATQKPGAGRGPTMTMRERLERALTAAGFEVEP